MMCAESCAIWGEMKKMKKAFVVSPCNPNFQNEADAVCSAADEFTFKRYVDDERISFDMSL